MILRHLVPTSEILTVNKPTVLLKRGMIRNINKIFNSYQNKFSIEK